jgi:hypothetical protein
MRPSAARPRTTAPFGEKNSTSSGNWAIKRFQSHALNAARCSSTTFSGVGRRFRAGSEGDCALTTAKEKSPAAMVAAKPDIHQHFIFAVSGIRNMKKWRALNHLLHVDTCRTCLYAGNMSKMVQVTNVPEQVHSTLKACAAREGVSLSHFI